MTKDEKLIAFGAANLEQARQMLNEICGPQIVILYKGSEEIDRFNAASEEMAKSAILAAQANDKEVWGGYKPVPSSGDFPLQASINIPQ